jgi:pseudomonalisin
MKCLLYKYSSSNQPIVVWASSQTLGIGGIVTSGMACASCYAAFQSDGNLVLYYPNAVPYWSLGTSGHPVAFLEITSTAPYVQIVPPQYLTALAPFILVAGRLSLTYGQLSLVMQTDGNLVLFDGATVLWATSQTPGIYGQATDGMNCTGCYAAFQSDGNLVLYNSSGNPYWSSGTSGYNNALLQLSSAPPYVALRGLSVAY